jgi:hypothetical protein
MHGIDADRAPYYRKERLANALRQTIHTEEVRTALYIVRDHQIVTDRLREKTKKTDRVWELEDLDDNDALGKGTGLKTVNTVSTSHLVRTIIHYRI